MKIVFRFDRYLKKQKQRKEINKILFCLIHTYKSKPLFNIYIYLYFLSRSFLTKLLSKMCMQHVSTCLDIACWQVAKDNTCWFMMFHFPIFVSTYRTSLYTLGRLVWVLNVHCCQLHLQSSAVRPVEYILSILTFCNILCYCILLMLLYIEYISEPVHKSAN